MSAKPFRRLMAAFLALPLILGGCASAKFVQTSATTYEAREPGCSLEIFSTALPERDYEEIGIIEGEGSFWKSDLADILPKIKEQACLAGGDAVIIVDSDTYAEDDGMEVQKTTATVIKWK